MGYVQKSEVYKVLSELLKVPLKEIRKWDDKQLKEGIALAHKIHFKS